MTKKAIIFVLLFLSVLILCFSFVSRSHTARFPVLGRDMIDPVHIVEDHRDVLDSWVSSGIHDAVLINVDAHDDLRKIPPAAVETLRTISHSLSHGTVAPLPSVSNSNFITAAIHLGLVRKVVWVLPASYGIFDDGEQLTKLLRAYSFSPDEISSFRTRDVGFVGSVGKAEVVITDIGHLPPVSEPVLLTIDVDYFQAMSDGHDNPITNGVRETFRALFGRSYAIRDASVAYSVNGEFLKTRYRWVGDLAIHALRQPAIMRQAELPDRYQFMQKADLFHLMERSDEVLALVAPFLAGEGTDPAAFFYAAQAENSRGNVRMAYAYAEKACQADKAYCYGLPELGVAVLDAKGLQTAEPFFTRGYELHPRMDHGQFALAMACKEEGRLDEAVRYFSDFRSCYGPFPADLFIGDTLDRKGDLKGAMTYYESARWEMAGNPYSLDGFGDRGAVEKAALFFERNGRAVSAAELRRYLAR